MNREVGYFLYAPPSARPLPVILWLHGRGGDEAGGLALVPFLERAVRFGLIAPTAVVFPNGGVHSMHCDSADGRLPVERFLVEELIPHLRQDRRLEPAGWAAEGMCMGGSAALRLAFRYPELFRAVRTYGATFHTVESMIRCRRSVFRETFASDPAAVRESLPETWARRNAGRIRDQVRVRLVVGTDDPVLEDNRRMHALLRSLSIPHDYREIAGVGHRLGDYYEQDCLAGRADLGSGLRITDAPDHERGAP